MSDIEKICDLVSKNIEVLSGDSIYKALLPYMGRLTELTEITSMDLKPTLRKIINQVICLKTGEENEIDDEYFEYIYEK